MRFTRGHAALQLIDPPGESGPGPSGTQEAMPQMLCQASLIFGQVLETMVELGFFNLKGFKKHLLWDPTPTYSDLISLWKNSLRGCCRGRGVQPTGSGRVGVTSREVTSLGGPRRSYGCMKTPPDPAHD